MSNGTRINITTGANSTSENFLDVSEVFTPRHKLTELDILRLKEIERNLESVFQNLVNQDKLNLNRGNIILAGIRDLYREPPKDKYTPMDYTKNMDMNETSMGSIQKSYTKGFEKMIKPLKDKK